MPLYRLVQTFPIRFGGEQRRRPRNFGGMRNEQYGLATGVLFAIGTLLLAFYFAPWRGSLTPSALPPELADEPDLHMEGATITQFQQDGTLRYRLGAREIRHFEKERFTRLLTPDLELHNESDPPWRITAALGEMHGTADTPDGERVLLRKSVVVHRRGTGSDYTTIRCETLDLYPERQYAETRGDVMIDTNIGRTRARGMQADLTRGSMKLSSAPDAAVHTVIQREQFHRGAVSARKPAL